jgi:hypothetical protein
MVFLVTLHDNFKITKNSDESKINFDALPGSLGEECILEVFKSVINSHMAGAGLGRLANLIISEHCQCTPELSSKIALMILDVIIKRGLKDAADECRLLLSHFPSIIETSTGRIILLATDPAVNVAATGDLTAAELVKALKIMESDKSTRELLQTMKSYEEGTGDPFAGVSDNEIIEFLTTKAKYLSAEGAFSSLPLLITNHVARIRSARNIQQLEEVFYKAAHHAFKV